MKEHMNEGLEAWTPPEPVLPVSNPEANRVRPLMDIALSGLTSSSTSGSQSWSGTSRLRELQEMLQAKTLENAAREPRPATWRVHLVRNVVISSYKKNVDGRYHRHNQEDWSRNCTSRNLNDLKSVAFLITVDSISLSHIRYKIN